MHPAFSVIFLTTLIGAGQGLFLALFTGQIYGLANLLPAQGADFYAQGSLLALVFLVAGLIASFFHLGRPERAWRSATRWRTSWLSREVILLPLLMALIFAYGLGHWLGLTGPLFTLGSDGWLAVDPTLLIGLLAALVTFGLFICTAMIYAGIRFLEEWSSPLTVLNFTLLGLSSGFLLAAAYSASIGSPLLGFFGTWALIFTVLALLGRVAALRRNGGLRHQSTLQSAIGVRHQVLTQRTQGATGGTFNTREFFHGAGPGTLRLVRGTFLLLAFLLPILLVWASSLTATTTLLILAFGVQYLGLVAERWVFFAEARHPQNLYYQTVA